MDWINQGEYSKNVWLLNLPCTDVAYYQAIWSWYNKRTRCSARQLRLTSFGTSKTLIKFRACVDALPAQLPANTRRDIELMFGVLKKKMKSEWPTLELNFSKRSGKLAILKTLSSIPKSTVRKIWLKMVEEYKWWVKGAYIEQSEAINEEDGDSVFVIGDEEE